MTGTEDARAVRDDAAPAVDDPETPTTRDPDPSKPVRRAIGVVSRRPRLLFAFALAAVVVALADVARILDPVGNAVPNALDSGVSLGVMTHPSGTRVAVVDPGAFVGLELQWVLAAVVLGLVAPVAAGVATTWTVARATNRDVTAARVRSTTTYCVAVVLAWQATAWVVAAIPELGVPVLLVGLWLAARLFPAPALAAIDRSPLDAASEAYALTGPRSVWLAVSVVGAGTLGTLLANLPSVAAISSSDPAFALGTFLSYAIAGTVGAVASTIYAVEAREERAAERDSGGVDRGEGPNGN